MTGRIDSGYRYTLYDTRATSSMSMAACKAKFVRTFLMLKTATTEINDFQTTLRWVPQQDILVG